MVGKWSWKLTPGFFALEGSRSSQHAPCKRSYKTFPGLEQVQAHSVAEPLSSRSVGQDWQPGRLEDPSNSRRWLEEDKLCECIRVVPDILNLWSPTTGGEECELRLANTTRRPKSHQVPCGRNTLGMDQQNGSPFEGQTFGLTASNNRQQHASAAWGSEGLRTTDSNKPFPSGGTGTLLRPCRWQRASSSSWLRSCLWRRSSDSFCDSWIASWTFCFSHLKPAARSEPASPSSTTSQGCQSLLPRPLLKL